MKKFFLLLIGALFLLGISLVFQTFAREKRKEYEKSLGWLFVISSILNITWIIFWQFEYLSLSMVTMFLLLASLISIYLCLRIGKSKVGFREKLFFHVPFSAYLGWITIAAFANMSVMLISVNWGGFGINSVTWAALIIIGALSITMLVLVTRKDIVYGMVIIWALLGIAAGQSGNQTLVVLAQASAFIVSIALVVRIFLTRLR